MRKFLGIVVATLLMITASVEAQDSPESDVIVKPGTYRDMTIWRKLKLGTAPYANPSLLKTAAVGYVYKLTAFDKKSEEETTRSSTSYVNPVLSKTAPEGYAYKLTAFGKKSEESEEKATVLSEEKTTELFKAMLWGETMIAEVKPGRKFYIIPPNKIKVEAGVPRSPKEFLSRLKGITGQGQNTALNEDRFEYLIVKKSPVSNGIVGTPLISWKTQGWVPSTEWATYAKKVMRQIDPDQDKER